MWLHRAKPKRTTNHNIMQSPVVSWLDITDSFEKIKINRKEKFLIKCHWVYVEIRISTPFYDILQHFCGCLHAQHHLTNDFFLIMSQLSYDCIHKSSNWNIFLKHVFYNHLVFSFFWRVHIHHNTHLVCVPLTTCQWHSTVLWYLPTMVQIHWWHQGPMYQWISYKVNCWYQWW